MLLIVIQNIQRVRERMQRKREKENAEKSEKDLGGSSLESQDNHPLMMMQVCI